MQHPLFGEGLLAEGQHLLAWFQHRELGGPAGVELRSKFLAMAGTHHQSLFGIGGATADGGRSDFMQNVVARYRVANTPAVAASVVAVKVEGRHGAWALALVSFWLVPLFLSTRRS